MKELSLHILDIVQNSISAGASIVKIYTQEDTSKDILTISVEDNGYGMDKQILDNIIDPFFTTRTTRRVGLGIPLLYAAAKRCEGDLIVESTKGKGTKVTAVFKYSHIDRAPLGNMADTVLSLVVCNTNVDFIYTHRFNDNLFEFSTIDIKNILKEVPLSSPEVMEWLREYLECGIKNLYGGAHDENNSGIRRNKKEDSSDS